ncbi:DUF3341 domain-containing protein [Arenibaculum sp.]|uniref:DUF3341 domain-containing protein n=1 Tax=Arenibaculum sp. TaxID=2865862 RepID=UPI002E0EFC55|nr:DUF3341 domain-containing protein [Arenibaculum sp.]
MTAPAYGLLARFDGPERLVEAALAVREAGYRRFDAFSPFPIAELDDVVPSRWPRLLLPLLTAAGAVTLGVGFYLLQYWTSTVDYPINVGGRPLHSWPSFLMPSITLAFLGASMTAVFWLLVLTRLPRLHHPLFDVPEFDAVTENGFFLCVRADDPLYDPGRTRRLLDRLEPGLLTEVAR